MTNSGSISTKIIQAIAQIYRMKLTRIAMVSCLSSYSQANNPIEEDYYTNDYPDEEVGSEEEEYPEEFVDDSD